MKGIIKKIKDTFPVTIAKAVMVTEDKNLNDYIEEKEAFISVKEFGAIGDGINDDAPAIQKALDTLKHTGGTIYFPPGTYLLKAPIYYYSRQHLKFDSATIKRGLASMNILITNYADNKTGGYGMTQDVIIEGAIIDNNKDLKTIATSLAFIHSLNTTIRNCRLKGQFTKWHYIEINGSKNTLIDRCYFEAGTDITVDQAEYVQVDGAFNDIVYPWAGLKDGTVCLHTTIQNCYFEGNPTSPAIGNHYTAGHKYIYIRNNVFDNFKSSTVSAINFVTPAEQIIVENNTFINCSSGITAGLANKTFVYNNVFDNVTTTHRSCILKTNIINGTWTA